MSILNVPGKPDQRPESERMQIAKGVIDLLVNRNLIPLYDGFKIDNLFSSFDGEEKQQAYFC